MQHITTVLFDLDGTLLPMDQDVFIKAYFGGLSHHLAPHGYDPKALIDTVWRGTGAMVQNTGEESNETVFWKYFASVWGKEKAKADYPLFEEFYEKHFDRVQESCGCEPMARTILDLLHQKGVETVLATNPIFPAIATEKRIAWAGLNKADFSLITTYENASFCKPNPSYYRQILQAIGKSPEECLMVGNDVEEDMIAKSLGLKVFLLTPNLISRGKLGFAELPQGDFSALMALLEQIPMQKHR